MHDAGMQQSLVDHLNNALARWQPPTLAVAFSGGMDSTALLHAIAHLPAAAGLKVRALHVDHGLHPESIRWASHCAEVGVALAVPVDLLRCEVARDSGLGLEGAARQARYTALAAALRPGEWLATAQHQDDQAETVLLRLLRASGTQGLAAMQATRPLGAGTLWRPLLDCPRAALYAYAAQHGLRWIEDPANSNPQHDRSWLRQAVMPLLHARWPQASAALARSAALLAADAQLIATEAQRELARCAGADRSTLRIDPLLTLIPALRGHVLRLWLNRIGADPIPARLLDRVQSELVAAAADAQPRLRYASTVLRRYRRTLHAERADARPAEPLSLPWDGRGSLHLPDGSQLRFDPTWTGAGLHVSYRIGGERIRLTRGGPRRALKSVLQEHGMPPWQRSRLPLLWSTDGVLLAAGDRIISAELAHLLHAGNCTLQWQPPPDHQPIR